MPVLNLFIESHFTETLQIIKLDRCFDSILRRGHPFNYIFFSISAYLLQDRRSCEPMFFLQDHLGEVLGQTCEVVLPYVGKVLTVVHAGGLIPGHESFDEPEQKKSDIIVTANFLSYYSFWKNDYVWKQKSYRYEV